MICQRCQKVLRASEGVKCDDCESRFHIKCVSESVRDHREAGDRPDRGSHWRCAICNKAASRTSLDYRASRDNEHLLNVINTITEKFELVNKIQLPKLNNDIMQIKSITERIAKQNEDILRKIDEIEKKNFDGSRYNCTTSHGYHRRSLNLTPRISHKNTNDDHHDYIPILTTSEKTARYRTRRRSYILHKIFHLLNKKINKSRTPRRKL